MTSEVLSMADHKPRQTTLRVDPELLRKARYYLDAEGKSVQEFLVQQLHAYVAQHDAAQRAHRNDECA
jgi:predicted HicB family RNase H-like nuclease